MSTEDRIRTLNNRVRTLDAFNLAGEVKRHAAVAARYLSYSEAAPTKREQTDWAYSAMRQEHLFQADVNEIRRRLEEGTDDAVDLRRWLHFFGIETLVARP